MHNRQHTTTGDLAYRGMQGGGRMGLHPNAPRVNWNYGRPGMKGQLAKAEDQDFKDFGGDLTPGPGENERLGLQKELDEEYNRKMADMYEDGPVNLNEMQAQQDMEDLYYDLDEFRRHGASVTPTPDVGLHYALEAQKLGLLPERTYSLDSWRP